MIEEFYKDDGMGAIEMEQSQQHGPVALRFWKNIWTMEEIIPLNTDNVGCLLEFLGRVNRVWSMNVVECISEKI